MQKQIKKDTKIFIAAAVFALILMSAGEAEASIQLPNGRYWWDLSTTGGSVANADANVNHIFPGAGGVYVGADIDWQTLFDARDIAYYHDWMPNLGLVYHQTKDEKYAQEWIYEIKDWMADEPPPYITAIGVASASYRVLNWIPAWLYFTALNNTLSSTDRTAFLDALKAHASFLNTTRPYGGQHHHHTATAILYICFIPRISGFSDLAEQFYI